MSSYHSLELCTPHNTPEEAAVRVNSTNRKVVQAQDNLQTELIILKDFNLHKVPGRVLSASKSKLCVSELDDH